MKEQNELNENMIKDFINQRREAEMNNTRMNQNNTSNNNSSNMFYKANTQTNDSFHFDFPEINKIPKKEIIENAPYSKFFQMGKYSNLFESQITSSKEVSQLIDYLNQEKSVEYQNELCLILLKNSNKDTLGKFLDLNGISIFNDWLSYYQDNITLIKVNKINELINNVLNICNLLPITVSELKNLKIGKKINYLGKSLSNSDPLKSLCEIIVNKWKKMVDYSSKDKDSSAINKYFEKDKFFDQKNKDDYKNYSNHNFEDNNFTNKKRNKDDDLRYSESRDMREFNKKSNYQEKQINLNLKPAKSILRKPAAMKNKAPIKWENGLEKEKVFKMSDEPNCKEITEEEHRKIQQEVLNNPNYRYIEDMKLREINMEKEQMNKQRDRSKLAIEILEKMTSQCNISELRVVYKGDDYDKSDSSESREKIILENQNIMTLATNYFKDSEIPSCPIMREEKLFDYIENDIPKIDNEVKEEKIKEAKETQNKKNEKIEIMTLIQNFIFEHKVPVEISNKLLEKIHSMENFTVEDLPKVYSSIIEANNIAKMNSMMKNPYNYQGVMPSMGMFPPPRMPLESSNMQFNNMNPMMLMHFRQMQMQAMNKNTQNPTNPNPPQVQMNTSNILKQFTPQVPTPQVVSQPVYQGKMDVTRYKTKPCKHFHSSVGCERDIKCFFIHDQLYKGIDIPNFNPDNYREEAVNKPFVYNQSNLFLMHSGSDMKSNSSLK